jgi:RHS repeat-associated protein
MTAETFHTTFSTSHFWLSQAKNGSVSGLWSGVSYRFGFNGKENDNEVKGTGNQQDYGMRIYDPRLGRFLSADPLIVQQGKYPELSAYQFASNTPIQAIDLDGLEGLIVVNIIDMPNGFNSAVFCKEVERRLIENGAHPDTRVVINGSEEYKALNKNDFYSNQSAEITIRNFNLILDKGWVAVDDKAGGYGHDNEVVLFKGLTKTEHLIKLKLAIWLYVNAALHEIGHAVYGFTRPEFHGHDKQGNTKTGDDIMDYDEVNGNPNAKFSEIQRMVISMYANTCGCFAKEAAEQTSSADDSLKGALEKKKEESPK